MTAALGKHLVLQDDAGGARVFERLDAAHDVVQIAVTGVAVGNHRDRHALRHTPDRVGHLLHAQKIQIRQPIEAGAGAEAADEDRFESRLFDQHGGQHIVRAERTDDAGSLHQLAQLFRGLLCLGHSPSGSVTWDAPL